MIVVLAKAVPGGEVYLKQINRRGAVEEVAFWNDAAKFHSKQAAREAAQLHADLRNSDEWKPAEITLRCERTR